MTPPRYADLYRMSENDRITQIGENARTQLVGVLLEKDEPEKVARYIRKVIERFPSVRLIDQTDDPASLTVTLRFGPRERQ